MFKRKVGKSPCPETWTSIQFRWGPRRFLCSWSPLRPSRLKIPQWEQVQHKPNRSRVCLPEGWPRKHMNSVAETELLMQLAALLMPDDEPIEAMFRNFPAPEGWGGHYLEPDLSLCGVLNDENAALFVEYDGYWRHEEKEGIERDRTKNAALLQYAPLGSYVMRISHTRSKLLEGNVLWIKIDTWRQGDSKTLSKVLQDLLLEVKSSGLRRFLHPRVANRLTIETEKDCINLSSKAQQLAHSAVVVGTGNTSDEISNFLVAEGFGSQVSALMKGLPWGISIERTLKTKIGWMSNLGITKRQLAKAVATHPQILGYSLEQNLKPTVQWLLDLGLPKRQLAKAVATHPHILGYSIEQNLKPTVQWLLDLGLTKRQIAKAVATFPLGYSIEQNLQPTVQWLLDLGLPKRQLAKAVATHPQILGYSIEQNLKPTVQWLLDLGLTERQIAKAVATHPHILGYSIERNLKPTNRWLQKFGVSDKRLQRLITNWPSFLGFSLANKLEPAALLLESFCPLKVAREVIASNPEILRFSHKRLAARLRILSSHKASKVYYAMCLTDALFEQRFGSWQRQRSVGKWQKADYSLVVSSARIQDGLSQFVALWPAKIPCPWSVCSEAGIHHHSCCGVEQCPVGSCQLLHVATVLLSCSYSHQVKRI